MDENTEWRLNKGLLESLGIVNGLPFAPFSTAGRVVESLNTGSLSVNQSHFSWLMPSAMGTRRAIRATCMRTLTIVFRVRPGCQRFVVKNSEDYEEND